LGTTCNVCKCELRYVIYANGDVTSNKIADRINNNRSLVLIVVIYDA
jgi:hypothetical protein